MPTWLDHRHRGAACSLAVGGAIARAAPARPHAAGLRGARWSRSTATWRQPPPQDRGWARDTLEEAARRIYAQERGGEPPELTLVEVLDRPGTDDDQAVFRCGCEQLTLGRRDGEWVHESLR